MTSKITQDQVPHAPDDLLHPYSRKLFRHWESIRGELSAPRKSEVDLRHIAELLPQIGILERQPLQSLYNWRLAGTGICKIFGHEVTKCEFMAGWNPFEKKTISRALDATVSGHQPCVARLKGHTEDGDMFGLELLALPIATKRAGITHVLVSLSKFRDTRRIEQHPLTTFELSRLKMIWTEHADGKVHSRRPEGLEPAEADGQARPVFRVIEGGLSLPN